MFFTDVKTKFALALGLSALALGCSRKHDSPILGQETYWLSPPLDPSNYFFPLANKHVFRLKNILVEETNDDPRAYPPGYTGYIIDLETILTRNQTEAEFVANLLKAAYPDAMGGPTAYPGSVNVGGVEVETVEQYARNDAKGGHRVSPNSHSNQLSPAEEKDYRKTLSELLSKMKGYDILVLRFVDVKRQK